MSTSLPATRICWIRGWSTPKKNLPKQDFCCLMPCYLHSSRPGSVRIGSLCRFETAQFVQSLMDVIFDVLSLEERGTKSRSDEMIIFEIWWQIMQHSRRIIKLVQFFGMDLNVSTCKKKKWYYMVYGNMFLLTNKGDLEQALRKIWTTKDEAWKGILNVSLRVEPPTITDRPMFQLQWWAAWIGD